MQSCGAGKCLNFGPCVQCDIWKSGKLDEEQCKNCSTYSKITELSSLEGPLRDHARLCTLTDETTGCDFNFTYKYSNFDRDYAMFAQNRQQCPEEVDILGKMATHNIFNYSNLIFGFSCFFWSRSYGSCDRNFDSDSVETHHYHSR